MSSPPTHPSIVSASASNAEPNIISSPQSSTQRSISAPQLLKEHTKAFLAPDVRKLEHGLEKINPDNLIKSSVLADYNDVRAEAIPLTKAANKDAALKFFRFGDPDYDPNEKKSVKVSIWNLLSYSTPKERALMCFGVLMATICGLGIPVWLVLLARSLDTFSNLAVLMEKLGDANLMDFLRQELFKLCVAFALVGVFSLVSGFAYVGLWTYTGEKQALRIQEQFVRSSLNQDAAWFDQNGREELPTKMGSSLIHISSAIGRQIMDVYSNGISALGCLIVALLLNTALTLIMLVAVPVVIIIAALFNMCVRRVKKRASSELAEAGGIATEVLAGIKTVAALCAQSFFRAEYCHHVDESARASIKASFLSSLLAGITGAIFYVTYIYAFYIGTEQVVEGAQMVVIVKCLFSEDPNCRVTGASVMCCIYGVILCVTFIGLMGPGMSIINLGRSAAVEVFDTLRRTPVIDPSSSKGKKLERVDGKIEFRDVFFYYGTNPNNAIFHNFNLTIEPGQSVALVGPSGCGKSTIARLLLRFYDPNSGNLIIDGTPLTAMNVSWWRSQIGYVAQEPVLFPGTIRENIAIGKPPNSEESATSEEVVQAAKMACAHDFITEMPDGYDTYFGGTSVQLSGGQMQRIAIARALLRNPRILILDEATSALDQLSEEVVQEALHNIREKKKITTVTIAHRLTTIVDSDKIAVISQGKIAEIGDHNTLLQKEGGIYRSLCESQGITPPSAPSAVPTVASSLSVPSQKENYSFGVTDGSAAIGASASSGDLTKNYSALTIQTEYVQAVELPSSPSGHVELGLPHTSTMTNQPMLAITESGTSESSKKPESFSVKEVEINADPTFNTIATCPSEPKSINSLNKEDAPDQDVADEAHYDSDRELIPEKATVEMAPMSKIWSQVGWDAIYTFVGIIGSGIVGALSPCESILTAEIVNTFYTVEPDQMVEQNWFFINKFFIFAAAALVGNAMVGIGLSRSGSNLGAKMRKMAFTAMMQRSMGWFDLDEHTIGELTTILGADVEAVEGLTGLPLGFRIRVISSIVTGVSIALSYSLKIGLVAIVCVPFIMFAGVIQVICLRKKFVARTDGLSPPTIMETGLRGIASVQAYNLENKVGDDYEKALKPEAAGKMKRGLVAGAVFGFSQFSIFVSFAIIFYVGTELLVTVQVTFVQFFTALLSVMFGAIGASQVSADFNSRQRARIGAARIFSVLEGPSDGSDDTGGDVHDDVRGAFKFDAVEFSYPSRPDRLIFYKSSKRDGMSLDIAEKESIGLVGRSGCGKSTILQIILRFYDINNGSAKLDGREISELNVNHLRNQVGYVGQLPTLFNGTVRHNILLGKQDATEEEIVAAAKLANAHDFITNLPDGYDFEVGAGGGHLSGGQRQRIAIARAIIRDPKILVLDEATAALDNESQKVVQAALDDLHATRPRTTLTVAHRLLTVKDCDKIVFLGDGGVLEMGSHSELLHNRGEYYNLWILQGSEEESENDKLVE